MKAPMVQGSTKDLNITLKGQKFSRKGAKLAKKG
jgi:hypothetical protein